MWAASERFREVVAGSHRAISRARVLTDVRFGIDPPGLVVPILDGDVKMASTSDVKATLDLTTTADYFDLLKPYGNEVFVERGVDFGDGTREYVPLGYYRIEKITQERPPYGPVTIDGKDRIAQLQQNRVLQPYQVPAGTTHAAIFSRLVNGDAGGGPSTAGLGMFIGSTVPIHFVDYDPTDVTVPAGAVVEDSTYEFLAKLADARGCVLVFDESGELFITPREVEEGTVPVFSVRGGAGGVLVSSTRGVTRDGVYNIVSAYGSDPAAPTGYQTAFNDDRTSPLYWGGRFGAAPRFYASPVLKTKDAAAEAARTHLARSTGLPSTLSLMVVPNPAIRPLDMISATLGGEEDVHVVDSVTIPLKIADAGPVEIVTRQVNTISDVVNEPGDSVTPNPLPDPEPGTDSPAPTDPTGSTDGNPANPGSALWIGPQKGQNHFNVGIGTDLHRDTSSTAIAGGFSSANFYLSTDFLWVMFKVRADGATTSSNTKYERSELREFDESDAKSAWSGATGTHILRTTFKVTQAGNGSKPWVNVQQIHDAGDDVLRIMVKGTSLSALKLVALLRDVETTLLSSYTLGQEVENEIRVEPGGTLTITTNGVVKLTAPAGTIKTLNYFKAGCYPNSNKDTEGSTTSQFEAGIKRGTLYVFHTGYAPATSPPWKGTGGGSSAGGGGNTGGSSGGGGSTTARTAGPGGVAKPAGAVTGQGSAGSVWTISTGGTASSPRVVDGESRTVGPLRVTADWVVVQNYKFDCNQNAHGIEISASNVVFQNNDVKNVGGSGGDINALTVWGANVDLLYNTSIDFVGGDPGDSHTDWVQFWVSSSHPVAPNNIRIIGNIVKGPDNPSRNSSIRSIHQCIMMESGGNGGNSGGSSTVPTGWVVTDNVFHGSWNQDMKFNNIAGGIFARNTFEGSSDKVIDVQGSTGLKFYADNKITGSYKSTGIAITAGSGPANPFATVPAGTSTPAAQVAANIEAAKLLDWGQPIAGDEFEYAGAPDPLRWAVYDGPGNGGNGLRKPSALVVANGVLTCTGDNVAGGTTGGMALRRDERYCRVEVRLRAYSLNPAGTGNRYHPVLLMWPQSEQWPEGGELDFFETDVDSGKYGWFLHYPNHKPKTQEYGTTSLDIQNWHNYALDWSKSGMKLYVDGKLVKEYAIPALQPPGPMHFCFQLDNFAGKSMQPAKMEAQWVRVYGAPA